MDGEAPRGATRRLFFLSFLLVSLVTGPAAAAIISHEDAIEQAEHVERSQSHRDDSDAPQQV